MPELGTWKLFKVNCGWDFHCMFSIAGVIDYKPAVEIRLCLFMLNNGVGVTFWRRIASNRKNAFDMKLKIALLFIVALLACGSVSAHNEGGYRYDGPRNELRMSDARFERLVELVKSESFDSGKLKIIEAASLGGFFSCRQAADLLKLFSFSSEKKNALRLIAPSIVGLYGIEQLIEQFSFTSDKEEALRILGMPVRY